ncbi:MAG: rRNA small subunit methyltransferase B [Micromonosporaceae bacterium]|nr:rRNA small subunit methyltransferase B [Micromonosporaceae bacterium]
MGQGSAPDRSGPARVSDQQRSGPARRPPVRHKPPVDPARGAAYEAVAAVHRDDAYANLVLAQILRERSLGGRDAALATELTYGTLRARGTLDAIIEAAARREVERIDPPVRDALRLGAYQLLYTRVPPHAATATTVDLVRMVGPGAIGFANAVLRKIGERDREQWLAALAPAYVDDPVGHLALVHAHPPWIVRAFADALGGVDRPDALAATALELAEDNVPAQVVLCARPGRIGPEALAEEAGGVLGRHSPYAVVLPGGAPGRLASLTSGRAHVQDEGSQLMVTALLAAGLSGPRDAHWLDLCAGPGGKAALLGAEAVARGAQVTATEVVEHRASLVVSAVRGLPVEVFAEDGRDIGDYEDLPDQGFDRVLVDAPCAGLGSLRRRPEARWRRQPGDLPALTRLQRELLCSALRVVRPGGVVAYVTCSPHPAETRVSVESAIRRAGKDPMPVLVERLDARQLLPESLGDLGGGPDVQLWPHQHGTDGMYLSVLRRAA